MGVSIFPNRNEKCDMFQKRALKKKKKEKKRIYFFIFLCAGLSREKVNTHRTGIKGSNPSGMIVIGMT